MPTNPTSVIVEELLGYLEQNNHGSDDAHVLSTMASNTTTTVLEVSTVAVRKYLDDLQEQLQLERNSGLVVLLHLGVHYKGKGFQLEQCAYNNATFRIPDEQGFQPDKQPICESIALEQALYTPLDVNALCKALHSLYPGSNTSMRGDEKQNATCEKDTSGNQDHRDKIQRRENPVDEKKEQELGNQMEPSGPLNGFFYQLSRVGNLGWCKVTSATTSTTPDIRIFHSTNPGRFVCNYIYYYSLNKFCQTQASVKRDDGSSPTARSRPRFASLFLHVPPFKVIPKDEQVKFVVDLMKVIRSQVLSSDQ